jgi:hypothetical protein
VRAARLIQALLGCSYDMAQELAGEDSVPLAEDEDLAGQVAANLGLAPSGSQRSTRLNLPPEFKQITARSVFGYQCWNYLRQRGYSDAEVAWIVDKYNLQYTLQEAFAGRVIIPVYSDRRELITWTARAIGQSALIRYKTYPTELSPRPITDMLLGLPLLVDAPDPRVLVISEGPFDAIAVTALGYRVGVYGTCLFGLNVSEHQADLLDQLALRFPRRYLLLDGDAALVTLRLMQGLPRDVRPIALPPTWKDPGELCKHHGERFIYQLAA